MNDQDKALTARFRLAALIAADLRVRAAEDAYEEYFRSEEGRQVDTVFFAADPVEAFAKLPADVQARTRAVIIDVERARAQALAGIQGGYDAH